MNYFAYVKPFSIESSTGFEQILLKCAKLLLFESSAALNTERFHVSEVVPTMYVGNVTWGRRLVTKVVPQKDADHTVGSSLTQQ